MTNPLAYSIAALITTVKSLIVQIPGRQKKERGKEGQSCIRNYDNNNNKAEDIIIKGEKKSKKKKEKKFENFKKWGTNV